jgi:predicted acetyltransferase
MPRRESAHYRMFGVPSVRVVQATEADKPVVRNLLELYEHDFSEFDDRDVDAHGLYGYRYLDHYWVEADRRAFLIDVDGRWAGFALVRLGSPTDMSEFFVMRKFRRSGVGREAALAIFGMIPGQWQVRQLARNPSATQFWRSVIPVEFNEVDGNEGPVQHFIIPPVTN